MANGVMLGNKEVNIMNPYKTKGEVWKAYKEGKLYDWERDVILEEIEFRENLSEIGKIVFDKAIQDRRR
jgi:hypothetical protein